MLYIVCYDIADDRRRARMVKTLLNYGSRIQESVFAAHLDEELSARMIERIRKELNPAEDRAHVVRLCKPCEEQVLSLGLAEIRQDAEYFIV